MHSERMGETLLPKRIALPVFCRDPLSSNAYATEGIMLMLSVGGLGLFRFVPWIAAPVAMLLVVVVASYRQTCRAYPGGGYAVTLSLFLIGLLAVMNLRGTRESGTFFAIPTYAFIGAMFTMIALGGYQFLAGRPPVAESASIGIQPPAELGPLLLLAIVLRSFASGCTALTRVEGRKQRRPELQGAQEPQRRRHPRDHGRDHRRHADRDRHPRARDAGARRGRCSPTDRRPGGVSPEDRDRPARQCRVRPRQHRVFTVQVVTAAVLVLAPNTAFNGFPILASILGRDGYLPRQFARRGDRLVFSNGVVILAVLASALIVAFNASTTHLIQLYIIGVFVSFTLSQAGMAGTGRTCWRSPPRPGRAERCSARARSTRSARV